MPSADLSRLDQTGAKSGTRVRGGVDPMPSARRYAGFTNSPSTFRSLALSAPCRFRIEGLGCRPTRPKRALARAQRGRQCTPPTLAGCRPQPVLLHPPRQLEARPGVGSRRLGRELPTCHSAKCCGNSPTDPWQLREVARSGGVMWAEPAQRGRRGCPRTERPRWPCQRSAGSRLPSCRVRRRVSLQGLESTATPRTPRNINLKTWRRRNSRRV